MARKEMSFRVRLVPPRGAKLEALALFIEEAIRNYEPPPGSPIRRLVGETIRVNGDYRGRQKSTSDRDFSESPSKQLN